MRPKPIQSRVFDYDAVKGLRAAGCVLVLVVAVAVAAILVMRVAKCRFSSFA